MKEVQYSLLVEPLTVILCCWRQRLRLVDKQATSSCQMTSCWSLGSEREGAGGTKNVTWLALKHCFDMPTKTFRTHPNWDPSAVQGSPDGNLCLKSQDVLLILAGSVSKGFGLGHFPWTGRWAPGARLKNCRFQDTLGPQAETLSNQRNQDPPCTELTIHSTQCVLSLHRDPAKICKCVSVLCHNVHIVFVSGVFEIYAPKMHSVHNYNKT